MRVRFNNFINYVQVEIREECVSVIDPGVII